jgi:hypothetical protein
MKQDAKVALQLVIIRDLARKAIEASADPADTLKEIMDRAEEAQHLLEHGVLPQRRPPIRDLVGKKS